MNPGIATTIHLLPHEPCPPAVNRLAWMLSDAERAQVAEFRFASDRAQRLLARAFLRILLARAARGEPHGLDIRPGPWGKPGLSDRDALQFNVSHTRELIAVAVTAGTSIGVDVEDMLGRRFPLEVCVSCFTANECARLDAMDPAHRANHAFVLWTRKEALLKATGHGFRDDPRLIDVLAADGSFETPARDVFYAGRHWDLHDSTLLDRWRCSAACAAGGPPPTLVLHDMGPLLNEWARNDERLATQAPI